MKKKLYTYIYFILIFFTSNLFCNYIRPLINKKENALERLYDLNIVKEGDPIRLHLGCGQNNFEGYVNIDFPTSEHTVQKKVGADVFANIIELNFPANSVDEIRSHHVFEHFDRSEALALLCKWQKWLKVGGKLIIETPDFMGCVKFFLSPKTSYKRKQEVLRHIFGSHEAGWAIHCDGWYKEKFNHTLNKLGFDQISFKIYDYGIVLYNIIVTAYKKKNIDDIQLKKLAEDILYDSHLGPRKGKERIISVWLNNFSNVFNNYFD